MSSTTISYKNRRFPPRPVSASATVAPSHARTYEGKKPHELPRPLSLNEIADVVQDFRRAALNAIDAGFDGIQLHASNGYLIDQFLRDSANLRVIDTAGRLKTASGF